MNMGNINILNMNQGGEEEESNSNGGGEKEEEVTTVPLSEVVSDCVKRWFNDTLKEAKAGDVNMQVLVAQMYYTGYGVTKNAHKGRIWMTRASRVRSSVWKVSNKRPGYNASDSDSDELIEKS
ncbi:OLC1v1033579C1 [Oldenlandia corymbosa var. corymbosa]|uniref:OLC1v1033579C1 n=1 Tax=Oldenlandia corymbosa var. corymbosa TaxID=529605 RepID=A0AAV1CPB6_OLDCO|nr:OLC1v1033579C1 [Oldenlandia corymbosa var. corymbosa]